MELPSILLSTSCGAQKNYSEAFEKYGFLTYAGYLPQDAGYDALVICGGGDIDPAFFGEKNLGSNPPDIERDMAELYLFEKYYTAGKPIFGICRGCQMINIALGGKLDQHISTHFDHTQKNGKDAVHLVVNTKDSVLHPLYGDKMTVNSAHHQACSVIGQGLSAIQYHPDGTVEAIAGRKILAFQWHPERMTCNFFDLKYSDPSKVFNAIKNMID